MKTSTASKSFTRCWRATSLLDVHLDWLHIWCQGLWPPSCAYQLSTYVKVHAWPHGALFCNSIPEASERECGHFETAFFPLSGLIDSVMSEHCFKDIGLFCVEIKKIWPWFYPGSNPSKAVNMRFSTMQTSFPSTIIQLGGHSPEMNLASFVCTLIKHIATLPLFFRTRIYNTSPTRYILSTLPYASITKLFQQATNQVVYWDTAQLMSRDSG